MMFGHTIVCIRYKSTWAGCGATGRARLAELSTNSLAIKITCKSCKTASVALMSTVTPKNHFHGFKKLCRQYFMVSGQVLFGQGVNVGTCRKFFNEKDRTAEGSGNRVQKPCVTGSTVAHDATECN